MMKVWRRKTASKKNYHFMRDTDYPWYQWTNGEVWVAEFNADDPEAAARRQRCCREAHARGLSNRVCCSQGRLVVYFERQKAQKGNRRHG